MRQLLGVWVAGSLTLGTVALIFVLHRSGPGILQPMVNLGAAAWLVALLNVLLVVALALLALQVDSWLTGNGRGKALWTLVVFVGGLAGWGYAASVVLTLNWSPTMLVVLAYAGGGLPFAAVATTLGRSRRAAGTALAVAVVLLVVGAALVAEPETGPFGILQQCAVNLLLLLAPFDLAPLFTA